MAKKTPQINIGLASLMIAAITSLSLPAQQVASRPSLVVGIVVDGLTMDNIDQLRSYFSDSGFNRLLNDGVTVTDLNYQSTLDPTAATAIIMTGASPAVNGIDSGEKYDISTRRAVSVFSDPSIIGNYTNETYSPTILKTSTIGDEIRIATGGLGHVYSIAPNHGQAIVMAGHAGNSGFWINKANGKWATTTFYKDVPTVIQTLNYRNSLESRLDTMVWTSTIKPEKYPDLPKHRKLYSFRHTFYSSEPDRFNRFVSSPLANREVTNIASDYIRQLNLGKSENMDMLNIAYTLSPYPYGKDADNRMEVMDSYIRLDADLTKLFKAIESGPGMDNTLIFLTGTPAIPFSRKEDEKWALATGEFSPRRAISLLNMYLIALHGNGEWVTGYHNNQIFLNRDLIKSHDIDLKKIRTNAAEFLVRMEGVSAASSIDDVLNSARHSIPVEPHNINLEHAGDVYVAVLPGWEIIDDGTTNPSPVTYPLAVRIVAPIAPGFILYTQLKAQRITTPVDARAIAPTVSSLSRIRAPNAATQPPLRLEKK